MREQRRSYETAQTAAIAERKSEHRWRIAFQALVFGLPALLGLVYFLFFMASAGFKFGPMKDVVGVIRINGPIVSGEHASAEHIVPAMRKAFRSDRVKAVVLSIDSPGGAPVESERIYSELAELKKLHEKPVVAVIHNIGASAAYMVAMHADHVVAARYSMVGSIGAVMSPWNVSEALEHYGIKQRVFASAPLKDFLNPFTRPDAAADAKARHIVGTAANMFHGDVRALRGAKLKSDVNVATGEMWSGPEALELGLIDSIGTLESYLAARFAGIQTYDFGPSQSGLGVMSSAVSNSIASWLTKALLSTPELR